MTDVQEAVASRGNLFSVLGEARMTQEGVFLLVRETQKTWCNISQEKKNKRLTASKGGTHGVMANTDQRAERRLALSCQKVCVTAEAQLF